MSEGLGLATILGCLDAGEKLMGLRPEDWKAANNANFGQHMFVDFQRLFRPGLKYFDAETLRSFATNVHPDLLKKMAEWKMRLDSPPDDGPDAIYMISQLREQMNWLFTGKRADRDWPEFVLTKGIHFYNVGYTDNFVVRIDVAGGDKVFVVRLGKPGDKPLAGLDIYQVITLFETTLEPALKCKYEAVQIPCIYAEMEPSLNWILGMHNRGKEIAYAQQKLVYAMNEVGFVALEETAMTALEVYHPEPVPFILSPNGENFLLWRRRKGVEFPISMFHFTPDNFKDPGDLSKIVE